MEYPEFIITICTRPKDLNQLCLLESSNFILRSAEEYHLLHRWHCSLMLLMPDHLHALIQVPERLNDHRIRRSESLTEKWNYIVMNPVRAGFVSQPEHWPHRWSPEGRYGTDDRPGHPRTSETLVRTIP